MRKIIDLIGQKFGKLTVIKMTSRTKYRSYMWLCECDCGNIKEIDGKNLRSGQIISCNECKEFDLIGKTFGKLKVIRYLEIRNGHKYFYCECGCGTTLCVRGSHLESGAIKSCGCSLIEDISGQIFSYLTAIRYLETRNTNAYWLCECICGNKTEVAMNNLKREEVKSCGCHYLISETKLFDGILEILANNFIIKRHYRPDFLGSQHVDMAIFKNDRLLFCVEYDGEQHFEPIPVFGGTEGLKKRKTLDKKKNKKFKDNDIPLIRFSCKEEITKESINEKLKKAGVI